MIWYSYNFTSFEEIIEKIPSLFQLPLPILIWSIFSVIGVLFCIYVFFPLSIIWIQDYKAEKEKKWKKKLLQQILLQKELEDEVEKEIKMQE